jgi:hypothetical protein
MNGTHDFLRRYNLLPRKIDNDTFLQKIIEASRINLNVLPTSYDEYPEYAKRRFSDLSTEVMVSQITPNKINFAINSFNKLSEYFKSFFDYDSFHFYFKGGMLMNFIFYKLLYGSIMGPTDQEFCDQLTKYRRKFKDNFKESDFDFQLNCYDSNKYILIAMLYNSLKDIQDKEDLQIEIDENDFKDKYISKFNKAIKANRIIIEKDGDLFKVSIILIPSIDSNNIVFEIRDNIIVFRDTKRNIEFTNKSKFYISYNHTINSKKNKFDLLRMKIGIKLKNILKLKKVFTANELAIFLGNHSKTLINPDINSLYSESHFISLGFQNTSNTLKIPSEYLDIGIQDKKNDEYPAFTTKLEKYTLGGKFFYGYNYKGLINDLSTVLFDQNYLFSVSKLEKRTKRIFILIFLDLLNNYRNDIGFIKSSIIRSIQNNIVPNDPRIPDYIIMLIINFINKKVNNPILIADELRNIYGADQNYVDKVLHTISTEDVISKYYNLIPNIINETFKDEIIDSLSKCSTSPINYVLYGGLKSLFTKNKLI